MSKIESLPGQPLKPEVLLHQVLEDAPRLRGVIVVTIDKDDVLNASWSSLESYRVAFAGFYLQSRALEVARERGRRELDEPPESAG